MENRTNAIATAEQTAQVQNQLQTMVFSHEEIEVIKATVAKSATDMELAMFLHNAQKFNLDPFAKEIWFIKQRDTPVIMTSRDGYLKIAHSNPNFVGLESDVVYMGDKFRKINGKVEHIYGSDRPREIILGAYTLVYRKDMILPVYCWAPINNYFKDNNVWQKYTHAMILKVAESMALKRAFSISGLVTREEMDIGEDFNGNPITAEYFNGNAEPANTPQLGYRRVVDMRSSKLPEPQQPKLSEPVPDAQEVDPTRQAFEQRKKAIWQSYVTKCGGDVKRAQQEVWAVIGQKAYGDINEADLNILATMPNFDTTPDIPNPADTSTPIEPEVV